MKSPARYLAALTLAIGLAIAAPLAASAETINDTTGPVTGSICCLGAATSGETPTYGQSVVAPTTDTVLTQFAFTISGDPAIVFRGQVYAWDGDHITGPALYTSDARTLVGTDFQVVTFDTGGVQLVAGQQYMLLGTTLLDPQTSTDYQKWAWATDSTDALAGNADWSNEGTLAGMTGSDPGAWDHDADDSDMSYRAVFEKPLTVTAVDPATGSAAGGSTVTITGTGFTPATGVLFGTVPATSFTVISDTQITAVAPAQAAGVANITVQGEGLSSAVSADAVFTYTAVVAPAAVETAAVPELASTGTDPMPAGLLGFAFIAVGVLAFGIRRVRGLR